VDLLEHFAATRAPRGQEQCACCEGAGSHGAESCARCDGSGFVRAGSADPFCPGHDQDQPAPPKRRHWRERTAGDVGEYGIGHRPLSDGAPAHDLTEAYQEDIYTHPQYWAAHNPPERDDLEGYAQLLKARGKPDEPVHIFRATHHSAPHEINPGDWVTLSKTYAGKHAWASEGTEDPEARYVVHHAVVPAKHVRDAGTDYYREQGYWGPAIRCCGRTAARDRELRPVGELLDMHSNEALRRQRRTEGPLATWSERTRVRSLYDRKAAEMAANEPAWSALDEPIRSGTIDPVLLEWSPTGHQVVSEGGHRIVRAHQLGVSHLPVSFDPGSQAHRYDWEEPEPLPGKEGVLADRPEYGPRPEYEPLPEGATEDEQMAHFERNRSRRNDWDAHVKRGLSLGHLSADEAKGLNYYFGGHETDSYGEPRWQPLPHEMYHATTDLAGVRRHGLKTRDELGQHQGGHGLGGGEDDTISVTTDHQLGRGILSALHEFHRVVSGRYTPRQMWEDAKAGRGASRPFHEDLARYWHRESWHEGDEMPIGLHNAIHGIERKHTMGSTAEQMEAEHGPGWRPARDDEGWMSGHTPPRRVHLDWEREMTPDEHRENAADFYQKFSAFREGAGGPEDPNFWTPRTKEFAAKDPRNFALLHVRPAPGGHGYPMGGMREWRTGTGDALDVHHYEQLHDGGQLHTAVFRRQAGARGDLPELEYYHVRQGREKGGYHAVAAAHQGQVIGHLTWGPHDDRIGQLWVHPQYRRHGVADAIYQRARWVEPGLRHHPDRTEAGEAWAASVSDDPAERLHDTTSADAERKGAWTAQQLQERLDTGHRTIQRLAREQDYGMGHEPDTGGPPLHDLLDSSGTDWGMPPDIYENLHQYNYGEGDTGYDAMAKIRKFRGQPDKRVRIWRSAPAVNPESRNNKRGEINHGDWIALSKEKALRESYEVNDPPRGSLPANHPNRYHIWSALVPARHVRNADGDITEWGYSGPDLKDLPHSSERCSHRARVLPEGAKRPERAPRRRSFWDTNFAGKGHFGAAVSPASAGNFEPYSHLKDRPRTVHGTSVPAAERHESVAHILAHYQPTDFGTWAEVDHNFNWDVPENREFVEDVRRNGVRRPVPVDYESSPPKVMNGHRRVLAAHRAGIETVPTRQHEGWMDPDDPDHLGRGPDDPEHWSNDPGWHEGALDDSRETMRRQAVAGPGYRNPHTGGQEWFHGSQAEPGELRRGFADPMETSSLAYEQAESETDGGHWKSLLWTHFTADHDVAREFASGEHSSGESERHEGYPGVVHVRLGLRNPKVYESEHDMDHEAYEREHAAGNHPSEHIPLESDDEDDQYEIDEMWHHAGQLHRRFGNGKISPGEYDMNRDSPFFSHPMRTTWLNTPPDKHGIAERFRQQLQEQGHDGIVYGNEYEKSRRGRDANRSAVVFDPGRIHITRHHDADDACPENIRQAARRKPLQPGQEECWKCGVRADKAGFTRASPYAPVMGLAMECTDKDACRQRREEKARTGVWAPTERIFGPTFGLDHRLFDEREHLRPAVRDALMGRLHAVLKPLFGDDWHGVLRVYLAGSEASRWTGPELEGNRDLDVLIGVAYSAARRAAPALDGMSDAEVDRHLNRVLQARYNAPGWHPPFDEGGQPWDLTGYVNHDALDIRKINPYAAYDLTDDRWAVTPPDLPSWSAESFPQGPALMQEARGLIAQVRAILRLPEPFRRQEAERIWHYIHEGRAEAFSPGGLGWQGAGNVLEKALDQASGGLVAKLKKAVYEPSGVPMALGQGMTTADAGGARA